MNKWAIIECTWQMHRNLSLLNKLHAYLNIK